MAGDKDNGKRPVKRPEDMTELERVDKIGTLMSELALYIRDDESFVGRIPTSKIADGNNKIPTRIVCVNSPKVFYQLDGITI